MTAAPGDNFAKDKCLPSFKLWKYIQQVPLWGLNDIQSAIVNVKCSILWLSSYKETGTTDWGQELVRKLI